MEESQSAELKPEKASSSNQRPSVGVKRRNIELPSPVVCERRSAAVSHTSRRPVRKGIEWDIGARLEAEDFLNKWYPAKIVEVDDTDMTVLIHFDGWNQRYDEWVSMTSQRLRPVAKQPDRIVKKGNVAKPLQKEVYRISEYVFARWTDAKFYPAKVMAVLEDDKYDILFYDGLRKIMKSSSILIMPPDVQKQYKRTGLLVEQRGFAAPLHPGGASSLGNVGTAGSSATVSPDGLRLRSAAAGSVPSCSLLSPTSCSSSSTGNDSAATTPRNECGDKVPAYKRRRIELGQPDKSLPADTGAVVDAKPCRLRRPPHCSSTTQAGVLSKCQRKQATSDIDHIASSASVSPNLGSPELGTTTDGSDNVDPVVATGKDTKPTTEGMQHILQAETWADNTTLPEFNVESSPNTATSAAVDGTLTSSVVAMANVTVTMARRRHMRQPIGNMVARRQKPMPLSPRTLRNRLQRLSTSAAAQVTPTMAAIDSCPATHAVIAGAGADTEAGNNQHQCTICKKSFRNEMLLDYHMKYFHHIKNDGGGGGGVVYRRSSVPVELSKTTGAASELVPASRLRARTTSTTSHCSSNGTLYQDSHQEMCVALGPKVDADGIATFVHSEPNSSVKTPSDTVSEAATAVSTGAITKIAAAAKLKSLPMRKVINCVCQQNIDMSHLIQCTVCLCWQHARCSRLPTSDAHKKYVCYVCVNPPGVRESARYSYDQDWLREGRMAEFACLEPEPNGAAKAKIMKATHDLVTDIQNVLQVMDSVNREISVVQHRVEPEFGLWVRNIDSLIHEEEKRFQEQVGPKLDVTTNINIAAKQPHQPAAVSLVMATSLEDLGMPVSSTADSSGLSTSTHGSSDTSSIPTIMGFSKKENSIPAATSGGDDGKASQINAPDNGSETCIWADSSQAMMDVARVAVQGSADSDVKLTMTSAQDDEATANQLSLVSSALDGDEPKTIDGGVCAETEVSSLLSCLGSSEATAAADEASNAMHEDLSEEEMHVEAMDGVIQSAVADSNQAGEMALDEKSAGEPDLSSVCEKNLLRHISRMQDELEGRLAVIEEQVNALENGEGNRTMSGDSLRDMPRVKKTIRQLISDLGKITRMSELNC